MNQSQLPTSADDIATRILQLIGNAHSPADLAPEGIERSTGIQVQYDPRDQRVYGFGNRMDDTWCYNLIAMPKDTDNQPTRLVFSFDDQTGHSQPPPAGRFDFEAYAEALKAAGYVGRMRLGPRGAFDGFTFERDGISVDVQVRGSEADPGQLRVSSLVIDAAEVGHG